MLKKFNAEHTNHPLATMNSSEVECYVNVITQVLPDAQITTDVQTASNVDELLGIDIEKCNSITNEQIHSMREFVQSMPANKQAPFLERIEQLERECEVPQDQNEDNHPIVPKEEEEKFLEF